VQGWQQLDSQIKLSWKAERRKALAEPEIGIFWDSATALNHSFRNPNSEKMPFTFLIPSCTVMRPFDSCQKRRAGGQRG